MWSCIPIVPAVPVQKQKLQPDSKYRIYLVEICPMLGYGWSPFWLYFKKSRLFSNFGHCEYFGCREYKSVDFMPFSSAVAIDLWL